jgi:hypothetical protein
MTTNLAPATILDARVPQPGRYKDYGVPAYIAAACDVLYRARNTVSDEDVNQIDPALFRLLQPWIRD